jgi:chromosome segregation protein
MEITLKQREVERMKVIIKQITREKQELQQEIQDIENELDEKEQELEEKQDKEQEIQEKFNNLLQEKNKIQDEIREKESKVLKKQNEVKTIEDETNNLKIKIAEIKAQVESINSEYKEFEKYEILKMSIEKLQKKLEKTKAILERIGTVNLKALEIYDHIKKEYDAIAEKVEKLQQEKQEIMKIIEEIDNKKKRAFKKTLSEINKLFSRNFSQLSTKGEAFLDPENKEDFFSGGLNIIIKVARGKYFDVHSLSGGEQTLIALSLIFAIQEYKPYCFYIFDEIDAALDKRNSERLTRLLKKHMKKGQYIVISHNDAVITEATTLYGISMQDGVSKILSLEV